MIGNEPQDAEELETVDEIESPQIGDVFVQAQQHPNSVQLNLEASGIVMQLHSQSPLTQLAGLLAKVPLVEVSSKLELVLSQYKECSNRLESAFFRIGFLEAQLEEKQREIEALKERLTKPQ